MVCLSMSQDISEPLIVNFGVVRESTHPQPAGTLLARKYVPKTKLCVEVKMEQHMSLGRPIEASLIPRYQCPVCGHKLWSIQAPWTGWQEWLKTEDGRRHYKNRCNIMEDAMIAFRRMFCA